MVNNCFYSCKFYIFILIQSFTSDIHDFFTILNENTTSLNKKGLKTTCDLIYFAEQ